MIRKLAVIIACIVTAVCLSVGITACSDTGNAGYTVSVRDVTLDVGGQMIVMPTFSDGQSHDFTVTVMDGGYCIKVEGRSVTAVEEGTATIKVTSGKASATFKVIVAKTWQIEFLPPQQMMMGESVALTASATDGRAVDLTYYIKSGADKANIVENELTATGEGVITVVCKDEISGVTAEATVSIQKPLPQLSATNVTVAQDQQVTAPVTVLYNFDLLPVEYSVVGGDGEISMLGETIVGVNVGEVKMEARLLGTDLVAEFTVTVTPRDYEVEIADVTTYCGDVVTLTPVITPAVYDGVTYTVTSGYNVVKIEDGKLTALKEGTATVELSIDGTEEKQEFTVTVLGFTLTVHDVQILAGEYAKPEAILTPAREDAEFKYEVVTGDQYVSVENGKVFGKKGGVARVLCTAVGKGVSYEFDVKVTDVKVNVAGKTIVVGESYTPTVTVDPAQPGKEIKLRAIAGADYVSIDGGTITAVKEGTATIRCSVDGTGYFADIKIEVINYVITASGLDMYEGDVQSIGASVSPYKKLVYEIVSGEDRITVDETGKVSGKKKGSATVRITAEGTDVYKEITVLVRGYVIEASNIEIMVLDGAFITPTVTPEKGRTVSYTIRSGEDIIAIEGNKVIGLAPGEAEVRASVEGVDAHVDVTVTVKNYEINHSNVGLYVGLTSTLAPKASPEKSFSYSYEIVSGAEFITIEGNKITAKKEGVAEVKITANEIPASKTISVTVADYAITVSDLKVFVGDLCTPEPVVVPAKENAQFKYDIYAGYSYAEMEGQDIKGVMPGKAIVRCYLIGSSAYFDFCVTVEHEMVDVPEGYVKISDYLYASAPAGRYKSATKINFFTPFKKGTLYYTTDGTPIKSDYSFAKVWSSTVWMTERVGSYNDYTLTQQVDAALTWAGGNKNYSALYVTNAQNGGKYNFINLSYVYNVAVVLDGEVVDTATQSYIVYSGYELDDMPIISLSMAPEYWFDGIANGKGESVYNNVYIPGGNAQNEKVARANLEFFDSNGGFEVNTQVKVGGGWSRGRPQRTLHLNFLRDENGVEQGYIEYEIFGDGYTTQDDPTEALNTFSRFRLHNGGSTYDGYTRMNDAIVQNIARGLNVSTTAWRPAIVYLNGEFWGMYQLREHYADVYFKENYDVKKGNVEYFDFTGGKYNLTDGDVTDGTAFINNMNAFLNDTTKNFADDEVFNQFFDTYVDEQSLMDVIIIQTYVGNWDWVGNSNNHRAWRTMEVEEGNPYTDGKLRFCLHDLDFGMTASVSEKLYLSQVGPAGREANSNQKHLLINRALANEGFRERLYDRAEYILENYFAYDRACKIIDDMVAKYEPAFYIDNDRWWKPQGHTAWKNSIANVKNWLKTRPAYFLPMLKQVLSLSDIPEMDASGSNVVYSNERIEVNEYHVGNGSTSNLRFMLRDISLTDYSVEYYAVRNGIKGIQNAPFFCKFMYHATNNNKTYVARFNNSSNSDVYLDIKEGTDSAVYSGSPGGIPLYEGVHKIKFTKKGTSLSLTINDVLITTVTLPTTVANSPVIGIDLYQHSSNMIYRNFVIKSL